MDGDRETEPVAEASGVRSPQGGLIDFSVREPRAIVGLSCSGPALGPHAAVATARECPIIRAGLILADLETALYLKLRALEAAEAIARELRGGVEALKAGREELERALRREVQNAVAGQW